MWTLPKGMVGIHVANVSHYRTCSLLFPFYFSNSWPVYRRRNDRSLKIKKFDDHLFILKSYYLISSYKYTPVSKWIRPAGFPHYLDSQLLPYMGIKRKPLADWSVGRLPARFSKCRFKLYDTGSIMPSGSVH